MESEITYPHINQFLSDMLKQSNPLLEEMESYARDNHIPIIQPESARLLRIMCTISKPKRILEIGTAIGYSAIILAGAMDDTSIVDTIEIDEEMAGMAKSYIKRAGFEKTIRILQGDAAEVLQCINTPYDFIFLDAAKGQYLEFLPSCLRLLNTSGIFITDNVLYRGMVAEEGDIEHKHRTIAVNLKKYLHELCNNEELITSIVPIGDGITICIKSC